MNHHDPAADIVATVLGSLALVTVFLAAGHPLISLLTGLG
ncbi:protein of unknown function [Candidatus Hydrogenisulfobacillus filiaventi]|uniref:Uncharacterized protein n=1 Tax=Candidatus Hydrogenisulfobacillus filiaventi TaxID=2707344 RepID=A0A6F8ZJT1_9FIRM|nr:protein of unknown function [Candidatus Hydrogenisulfobacillus filiaventi]